MSIDFASGGHGGSFELRSVIFTKAQELSRQYPFVFDGPEFNDMAVNLRVRSGDLEDVYRICLDRGLELGLSQESDGGDFLVLNPGRGVKWGEIDDAFDILERSARVVLLTGLSSVGDFDD